MSFASNLPAIQVALPLIAAPLCALVRRQQIAWIFTTIVFWSVFAIAIAIFVEVISTGPIHYTMGGWLPETGIAYVVDPLNALLLVLVAGMGATIIPAARLGIGVEVVSRARPLFYTVALLALTGMLGIVITGDVFNLYVFLEISSLASYGLVAMGADRRAMRAAFNYLIQGTVGATFILMGIGLAYMITGTLNMADMAARLGDANDSAAAHAALAFIVVGAGIKFALFPAHTWMPNAYTYAPSLVSAFFGATATKVGAYILIRFLFSVFGIEFSFESMHIGPFLIVLGLIGAVIGSLVAIWQEDLKRMLAYSSVAQVGYIAAAIGFANHDGMVGAVVHIFNHGLMKGVLFLIMACVILKVGTATLSSFHGLGRRMPVCAACFVVAGLSMIGVPFTVGFISKWYFILGAIEAGLWPAAAIIVLSSLLAVVYVWRVVEAAYFTEPVDHTGGVDEASPLLLVPVVILTVLCIVLGVFTDLTVGVASMAARSLGVLP